MRLKGLVVGIVIVVIAWLWYSYSTESGIFLRGSGMLAFPIRNRLTGTCSWVTGMSDWDLLVSQIDKTCDPSYDPDRLVPRFEKLPPNI